MSNDKSNVAGILSYLREFETKVEAADGIAGWLWETELKGDNSELSPDDRDALQGPVWELMGAARELLTKAKGATDAAAARLHRAEKMTARRNSHGVPPSPSWNKAWGQRSD